MIGPAILDSVARRNESGIWYCELALLMPDHAHLLVSFPEDRDLATPVGMWKHWLGRSLGLRWQRNFFEHRVRDAENLQERAAYILQNPVRAGLVQDGREWPYLWMPAAG